MNQIATLKSPRRQQTEIEPLPEDLDLQMQAANQTWFQKQQELRELKAENADLKAARHGDAIEMEALRSRLAAADSHIATANIECDRARVELEARRARITELETEKKLLVRTLRAGLDVLEEDQQIAETVTDDHEHHAQH